jgi:hypothetical protein
VRQRPRRRAPRVALVATALCALLALAAACSADGNDSGSGSGATDGGGDSSAPVIRLNHVQVLGSHNSYHVAPDEAVLDGIAAFSKPLAAELAYTHQPITEQLDELGVRQLEIDVYADPGGGRFANRPALSLVGLPTASGEPALDEPGFKVLHMVDIDFRASCITFVACLEEIEAWSGANDDHVPIMVMVEAKQASLADAAASLDIDVSGLPVTWTEVVPYTAELFEDLEAEILSVFARDRIITPDDVRGDHETLEAAVLTGEAWPTLEEARGKVLFSLVDTGVQRDVYVGDATSLQGRLLFTSSEEGRPDAAFVRVDDALDGGDRVRELVEAGYLVRSRADVPAVHAVKGDTSARDAALASGAHYVSTDYYVEDPGLGTGYVARIPGAPPGRDAARCNPVSAPPACEQRLVTG